MIRVLLFIGAGGFIGTIGRYLIGRYIYQHVSTPFPLGTFLINVFGCFLIGLFYGISEKTGILSSDLRLFLVVGLCGGFTTFSSFAYENLNLLRDGAFFYFAMYTALSVFLGLVAVYLGNLITKIL